MDHLVHQSSDESLVTIRGLGGDQFRLAKVKVDRAIVSRDVVEGDTGDDWVEAFGFVVRVLDQSIVVLAHRCRLARQQSPNTSLEKFTGSRNLVFWVRVTQRQPSEAVADELDNIIGIGLGGPAHDEAIADVDDLVVVVAFHVRLRVVQDCHLKYFEWQLKVMWRVRGSVKAGEGGKFEVKKKKNVFVLHSPLLYPMQRGCTCFTSLVAFFPF